MSITHTTTTPTVPDVAVGCMRIDALDAEIMRLIAERNALSEQVQHARLLTGGPRIVHARENDVVLRWRDQLGRPGAAIALALLELGRGRVA